MSLRKKLNNEIEEWNFGCYNIDIENTEEYHYYKIIDINTKEKIYFYYDKTINYKRNIKNLKLKVQELYSKIGYKKINNCYYGKKFIDIEEYRKCRLYCFYNSFCEMESD